MAEDEDLQLNEFLSTLKTRFSSIYNTATTNRWVICCPTNRALRGIVVTQAIVQTHVLQPSPYIHGHFLTLSGKGVEIKNNLLQTTNGFAQPRTVRIICEELFYNEDGNCFRVLCIEAPLEGGAEVFKSPDKDLFRECDTAEGYIDYLKGFSENQSALKRLDQSVRDFQDVYVMVRGFEYDAGRKVRQLCESAVEDLCSTNKQFAKALKNRRYQQLFKEAIECYVLSALHPKIFTSLCEFSRGAEARLQRALGSLDADVASAGLKPEFKCPLPTAVQLLQDINTYRTPWEKLKCVRNTVSSISKEVESHAKRWMRDRGVRLDVTLTADDLLPLLIGVVIQARPANLQANTLFMSEFHFVDISTNELGFHLANFTAAVAYIKDQAAPTPSSSSSSLSSSFSSYDRTSKRISPSTINNIDANNFAEPQPPSSSNGSNGSHLSKRGNSDLTSSLNSLSLHFNPSDPSDPSDPYSTDSLVSKMSQKQSKPPFLPTAATGLGSGSGSNRVTPERSRTPSQPSTPQMAPSRSSRTSTPSVIAVNNDSDDESPNHFFAALRNNNFSSVTGGKF
eukprot:GILK01010393.1.p1 GENE.GILK01010393.1~~GILK01010393.1.p1  ORF type:complete len:582 (-),score=103.01 GILK01010393.1:127-1824(-)